MQIIPLLLKELDQEVITTRKMLERVPFDKFDWQPHEKSMTFRQLATHIAELPSWISMAFNTTELDFAANPYRPAQVDSLEDLLALFDQSVAKGRADLAAASEDDLLPTWTLRIGDNVLGEYTKYEFIRLGYSQTSHHRAQLGVFLRLLNIPIPGNYGPSADEPGF